VCPLIGLPRCSCGHCTGTDAGAGERAGRRVTMTARYPGRCAYCDGPIRAGERIRRAPGGVDRVHAGHDLDA
jgi:hypothetical protein